MEYKKIELDDPWTYTYPEESEKVCAAEMEAEKAKERIEEIDQKTRRLDLLIKVWGDYIERPDRWDPEELILEYGGAVIDADLNAMLKIQKPVTIVALDVITAAEQKKKLLFYERHDCQNRIYRCEWLKMRLRPELEARMTADPERMERLKQYEDYMERREWRLKELNAIRAEMQAAEGPAAGDEDPGDF